jgi:DNA-binding MarR family transcriptional regulator
MEIDTNSNTYIRFLNLAQALRGITKFPQLDPIEERMLNYLAGFWLLGVPATVVESINGSADISPSTAHRRLKSLRKKGYIDLNIDERDNRIKYIVQTELTKQYFSELGSFMKSAQQS